MKSLTNFMFAIVALVSFSLVSCGGGDDDNYTKEIKMLPATNVTSLKGYVDGATVRDTVTLSELVGSDVANNLIGIDPQNNWYFEVEGLNALKTAKGTDITLTNFTITINGTPYNMGTCSTNNGSADFIPDSELSPSSGKIADFMEKYRGSLKSNKKATFIITFKPNVDIVPSDNINLVLYTKDQYTYKDYN